MPRALQLRKAESSTKASVETIQREDLPKGDVEISVLYSSLNYKDGLAVTGRGKIVRGEYPFVPGIDLAGRVEESGSDRFGRGDLVIATGWGIGEARWGGYSQVQRLDSTMLVPLPERMTPAEAMVIGTAGFTAMLSIMALEEHGSIPEKGEIVVTGASGGVGSMAVALLARKGYSVVASSGSADATEYLKKLGASRIIGREVLGAGPERPLDSARWVGAVDSVGGTTLAAILSQLQVHGSVASCGLAGGHELSTTVFPFILRGVNLLGIDSNTCPNETRVRAWQLLSELLTPDLIEEMKFAEIGLAEIPEYSDRILAGAIQGRVLVDVNR